MTRIVFIAILLFRYSISIAEGDTFIEWQIKQLEKKAEAYGKIDQSKWSFFSCDSCLYPGERSKIIMDLRTNLSLTGDLSMNAELDKELFDEPLKSALIK